MFLSRDDCECDSRTCTCADNAGNGFFVASAGEEAAAGGKGCDGSGKGNGCSDCRRKGVPLQSLMRIS